MKPLRLLSCLSQVTVSVIFGRFLILMIVHTPVKNLHLNLIKGEKFQDFFIVKSSFFTHKNSLERKQDFFYGDLYWENHTFLFI